MPDAVVSVCYDFMLEVLRPYYFDGRTNSYWRKDIIPGDKSPEFTSEVSAQIKWSKQFLGVLVLKSCFLFLPLLPKRSS